MRTFRSAGLPPHQTPVTAETQWVVWGYRREDEVIKRKKLQVDRKQIETEMKYSRGAPYQDGRKKKRIKKPKKTVYM